MTKPADCPPGALTDDVRQISRMWGGGWGRFLFPGFWLVYLGQTVNGVAKYSHGWAAATGYVIIGVFAFCYLAALGKSWERNMRVFWPMFGLGVVLTLVETIFAHGDAFVFCVYLSVLAVGTRSRYTPVLSLTLVAFAGFGPWLLAGGKFDWNGALTVTLVSIAMYGFFKIIEANIALAAARAEVARLAAENERTRIARDLHDLLGHSLTTITVKAGLARRLAARGEPERAVQEISEVEELSRRTLGEVRDAVAGYRDVTLSGELASAHELLRASGIEADLPGAIDIVDSDAAEVFGWVVREGVTNVVRHSRAARCAITLGPRWIEIVDDGRGGTSGAGNGITGLRERLAAVDGLVTATGCPKGWRLRAEMGAPATGSTDGAGASPQSAAMRP